MCSLSTGVRRSRISSESELITRCSLAYRRRCARAHYRKHWWRSTPLSRLRPLETSFPWYSLPVITLTDCLRIVAPHPTTVLTFALQNLLYWPSFCSIYRAVAALCCLAAFRAHDCDLSCEGVLCYCLISQFKFFFIIIIYSRNLISFPLSYYV